MEVLNPGKISDYYHIEDVIGEGISKVVRAISIKSKEEVAVKIIDTKELNEVELKNLLTEIEILSEVSHPNVLKLIEIFEDKSYYLVFELMKGGTLSGLVSEEEYLPEEKVVNLLLPIFDALSYCHNIGVTHRDMKVRVLIKFFF
jgi:serine/threonine protein kinase